MIIGGVTSTLAQPASLLLGRLDRRVAMVCSVVRYPAYVSTLPQAPATGSTVTSRWNRFPSARQISAAASSLRGRASSRRNSVGCSGRSGRDFL